MSIRDRVTTAKRLKARPGDVRTPSRVLGARIYTGRVRVAVALIILAAIAQAQETGTLHGVVLDPDGKPLAGRTISAHCVSTENPLSHTVKTNKRGVFRFEKLPAGSYILELGERRPPADKDAGSLGAAVAEQVLRTLANAMRRANAKGHPHLVKVKPSREVRHDIRVPRRLPVTVVLQRNGEPVRGAVVHLNLLNDKDDTMWTASVGRAGRRPRTGRAGAVTFPSVPEGRYWVFLDSDGWQVSCGVHAIRGKDPVRISLTLGRYAVRIRVLDARGNPVTTAEPGLASETHWFSVAPSDFVELRSPTGVYTIPYVQEGRYRPFVNVGWSHTSAPTLTVGPKTPTPTVELRLPATGQLVVRVVDRHGRA